MKTKFTKGEWAIDVWATMLNINVDDGEVGICEIEVDGHKRPSGYEIKPTAEQKANAHLIASAPDMYNEMQYFVNSACEEDIETARNRFILILKKARGE